MTEESAEYRIHEQHTDWRMPCRHCGAPLVGDDYRMFRAIEWLDQERCEISPRQLAICIANDAAISLYEEEGEAADALSAAFDQLYDLDADDLCGAVQHLLHCRRRPTWLAGDSMVSILRGALEQIALLADATEPVSVAMATIARQALEGDAG